MIDRLICLAIDDLKESLGSNSKYMPIYFKHSHQSPYLLCGKNDFPLAFIHVSPYAKNNFVIVEKNFKKTFQPFLDYINNNNLHNTPLSFKEKIF